MRNIKFRAWDKEQKCMVYSDEVYPKSIYKLEFDFLNKFKLTLTKMTDMNKVFYANGEETCIQNFELVDADIMQYIEVKDEDGKEIYEGDIVERIDRTPVAQMYGKTVIGAVGFTNGSFVLNTDEGAYSINNNKLSNMCSYRILGNIYENQELLK